MTIDYNFPHYLAAKRSIDDRALNRNVWNTLARTLALRKQAADRPLKVLEVAAGTGTMIERVLDWELFSQPARPVEYTATDAVAENIAVANQRVPALPAWFTLHLGTADVFDLCERQQEQGKYDLLIANAFLDLLDTKTALPRLRRLLRPGGLFYFTINFDGATILQPTIDEVFDAQVETAYHQTMDERTTDGLPSGDSRTGRHLFGRLEDAGYHLLAAGSSDWVVHPLGGAYPGDEAYFLHFIIHTMGDALDGQGAFADAPAREKLKHWVTNRHAQIERGELVYIAHQLDFAGYI